MPNKTELFEIIKKKISEITHVKNVGRGRIAEFLDVNPGRVRAWETGQRPSADDLELLSEKLDFNPVWLLTGRGDVFIQVGESEKAESWQEGAPVTDPIAQRMKVATEILKESGASSEVIQQAVMKILDSQNETHTQAETDTLEASAFADKCERSMKRT